MKRGKNTIRVPLFVSIPHSGTKVPMEADWLKTIPLSVLMCDVDAFVDELYAPALKEFQIPSVIFEWHRYAVDANRLSSDISSATVENAGSALQTQNEKRGLKRQNKEAGKGLATPKEKSSSDIHWHKTTKADLLISKPLSKKLHEKLIKNYFDPFHEKMERQFSALKEAGHPNIYLMDLHSMPSQGLAFHKDPGQSRPQVVIGDRKGKSCSSAFRDLVLTAYKKAGFETALNWPYQGGAITQRYGSDPKGRHSLQVELNRKLYMDENTKQKSPSFPKLQNQLQKAMAYIVQNIEQGQL